MKQTKQTGTSFSSRRSVSETLVLLSGKPRDDRREPDRQAFATSSVISTRYVDSRLKQFSCR